MTPEVFAKLEFYELFEKPFNIFISSNIYKSILFQLGFFSFDNFVN